jgi:hypothetical protein
MLPPMTTGPERLMLEHMLDRNRQALIDTARGLSESYGPTYIRPGMQLVGMSVSLDPASSPAALQRLIARRPRKSAWAP